MLFSRRTNISLCTRFSIHLFLRKSMKGICSCLGYLYSPSNKFCVQSCKRRQSVEGTKPNFGPFFLQLYHVQENFARTVQKKIFIVLVFFGVCINHSTGEEYFLEFKTGYKTTNNVSLHSITTADRAGICKHLLSSCCTESSENIVQ